MYKFSNLLFVNHFLYIYHIYVLINLLEIIKAKSLTEFKAEYSKSILGIFNH